MKGVSFKILLITFILTAMEFGINSYLVYMSVLLFTLLYGKKLNFHKQPNLVYAYLLIIITSVFRIGQYTNYMFNEIVLLGLGIIPFLFKANIANINIVTLNILCCLSMFLSTLGNISNINISLASILNSDIGTEGNIMPFIIPFFALYSLIQKKYKLLFLNIIMTIIGGKRIAFLGLIIAMIMYYYNRNKSKKEVSMIIKFSLISICIFYIYFIYSFCSGNFDSIIYEYTGLSSNALTVGRFDIYNQFFERKDVNYIYGLGQGAITHMLEGNSNNRFHNDLLKILGENGFFIFIIFLTIMVSKMKYKLLPYYSYLLVIFLTDNTLIYVPVTFIFCFFCIRINNETNPIFSENNITYEKTPDIPYMPTKL